MRLALAGFLHESNTFATSPTRREDFPLHVGAAVAARFGGTFHEMAGFLAGAGEYGFDAYPVAAAEATPAGPVTRDAYEHITGLITSGLAAAPALDGVLLALHGAMVVEDLPHADLETVRRVRQVVGAGVPIAVTHDYHANIPAEMAECADILVVYKTNPHIDQLERGLQAARILAATARGEARPVIGLAKPEVLLNIYFHNTSRPPVQPLLAAAVGLEQTPGVLAASVAAGYQYADVPAMGPTMAVVTDGDRTAAAAQAQDLADRLWAVREQLHVRLPGPADAVRQAMAAARYPVGLLDFGDNIGGGSAGDSTLILAELLAQRAEGWVVTLWDPAGAQACNAAGIGAEITLSAGGHTDTQHGEPVQVRGRVRSLHDGRYEETERRHGGGRHFDQGLTAVLAITDPGRGLLVLNTRRAMPNSIHQIMSLGIVPAQQRLLVAKGAVAPRAAYEPVVADLIEVDSGGATAIGRPASAYRRARPNLYEWRTRP